MKWNFSHVCNEMEKPIRKNGLNNIEDMVKIRSLKFDKSWKMDVAVENPIPIKFCPFCGDDLNKN